MVPFSCNKESYKTRTIYFVPYEIARNKRLLGFIGSSQ